MLTYDGQISEAAVFNPRELTIHFDGQRLIGAIGKYSYSWNHGTTQGWAGCSTWNLTVAAGKKGMNINSAFGK